MMNVVPVLKNSDSREMKEKYVGPRAETLALIRVFARIYEYNPDGISIARNYWLN
ncbi:MAG: hypothetical protein LBR18_08515 [Tannerella sp.]|jgi:hypothetical protein|nr:hypothetical protein [Tannerella sp.]